MPFIQRNLGNGGEAANRPPFGAGEAVGAGAPVIWTYRTEDAVTVVDTAGYFNAMRSVLRAGDLIYRVTINSSGVPQTAGFHLVNDVPATGNVDIADVLALTVTDTR